MSNLPNDNPTEWVMPEPVFRTSEGRRPGAGKGPDDDLDTLETETGEGEDDGPEPEITNEALPAVAEEIPANGPTQKRGCFPTFVLILGVIALLAATILAVVIYFLSSLVAPGTDL